MSGIRSILYLKIWNPFLYLTKEIMYLTYSVSSEIFRKIELYLIKYFFWCEAHCMDIVSSGGQLLLWSHHVLNGASETVINVHHWQPGVRSEVTLVVTSGQSIMEYLDSIVSGAATRVGVIGDDTREPQTSEVQAKSFVVIFTQQFSVDF